MRLWLRLCAPAQDPAYSNPHSHEYLCSSRLSSLSRSKQFSSTCSAVEFSIIILCGTRDCQSVKFKFFWNKKLTFLYQQPKLIILLLIIINENWLSSFKECNIELHTINGCISPRAFLVLIEWRIQNFRFRFLEIEQLFLEE